MLIFPGFAAIFPGSTPSTRPGASYTTAPGTPTWWPPSRYGMLCTVDTDHAVFGMLCTVDTDHAVYGMRVQWMVNMLCMVCCAWWPPSRHRILDVGLIGGGGWPSIASYDRIHDLCPSIICVHRPAHARRVMRSTCQLVNLSTDESRHGAIGLGLEADRTWMSRKKIANHRPKKHSQAQGSLSSLPSLSFCFSSLSISFFSLLARARARSRPLPPSLLLSAPPSLPPALVPSLPPACHL